MLQQRRIVVAVTGGVAAFKAAYLVRRLVEQGAEVRTVMTEAATQFIGRQTLAALTGHRHQVSDSTESGWYCGVPRRFAHGPGTSAKRPVQLSISSCNFKPLVSLFSGDSRSAIGHRQGPGKGPPEEARIIAEVP